MVVVRPSTRTLTWAARAPPASTAASATERASTRGLRSTNPPSARGSIWRSAAGLLTRGSPLRGLPSLSASGVVAERRLPSQRRDRPGFAPGSLTVLLGCGSLPPRPYDRPVSAQLRLWLPVVAWAALIFGLS